MKHRPTFSKPPEPPIPFTQEAYDKLLARRKHLYAEQKQVMSRLVEAREQGDLSENGAYKYAKFELGSIRRELRELNQMIARGQVQSAASAETVTFGTVVTLEDESHKQLEFHIVSEFESDLSQNKLSLTSPIGQAIAGKQVADQVQVHTPSGEKSYTITAITLPAA